MGSWKLYVRILQNGQYQIFDKSGLPGLYTHQALIHVTGAHKPEVPAAALTQAEYLHWKSDLYRKGDQILDQYGI